MSEQFILYINNDYYTSKSLNFTAQTSESFIFGCFALTFKSTDVVCLMGERATEVSCLLVLLGGILGSAISSLVMLLLASTLLIRVRLVVPRVRAAEDFL